MNGKEIGAAVVGIAAVAAAALSGALMTGNVSRQNVSQTETLPVLPEVPSAKSSIPPIGRPFILHEKHLTDWSGLSGGATADAKPVRTVAVHKPVSVQGFFLPGPN